MRRRTLWSLGLLLTWSLSGCEEKTPTALGEDLFPVDPLTFEVVFEWEDFGRALSVSGGFGRTGQLAFPVMAKEYQGVLNARTLGRFAGFPSSALVRDTAANVIRTDLDLTYIGGTVVIHFDTTVHKPEAPVDVSAHAIGQEWDIRSASWGFAIDSADHQVPWEEPGAGPDRLVGTATWDRTLGDSVLIHVDSAAVNLWTDPDSLASGIRLDVDTEGVRVDVRDMDLRLDILPSLRPDTVINADIEGQTATFVYDPAPALSPGAIRVGGAPSWRAAIEVEVPRTVNGPPELCQRIGCPFDIDPARVNFATLVLESATSEPGFQPTDSVRLDARPVFAPERFPKSPLGGSYVGVIGRAFDPTAFGAEPGRDVALPVTPFVQDLLRGETVDGRDPPSTVALLSVIEPFSLDFATFIGPGQDGEGPRLRLILTTADTVDIR